MEGTCKLCGKIGDLQQSHVLPSFVFKWMKQAGHIRNSELPNRRVQDGEKREWLCSGCEQLFNSFETPFATKVFHAYDADRKVRVRYGEWMAKFCASVAWRSLSVSRDNGFKNLTEQQTKLASGALETRSRFLLSGYKHTGSFELHMLAFAEIESTNIPNLAPNINRYLNRTIDIDVAASNSMCFSYSKLGPFAIFGFIQLPPRRWKGTIIRTGAGFFQPGYISVPKELWDYLNGRALGVGSLMAAISAGQQQKIEETPRASPERFLQSGLFRAMQRDVEMFGTDAFSKHTDQEKEEE